MPLRVESASRLQQQPWRHDVVHVEAAAIHQPLVAQSLVAREQMKETLSSLLSNRAAFPALRTAGQTRPQGLDWAPARLRNQISD